MFRKIRSNRDPQVTLFSEIRKEFRPYFEAAGKASRQVLGRYPRIWFGLMVGLLVSSLIFSFIVCHQPAEKPEVIVKPIANPVSAGFSKIMVVSHALQKTIGLKRQVDSLVHLSRLNHTDSLQLSADLDSLNAIRQIIK